MIGVALFPRALPGERLQPNPPMNDTDVLMPELAGVAVLGVVVCADVTHLKGWAGPIEPRPPMDDTQIGRLGYLIVDRTGATSVVSVQHVRMIGLDVQTVADGAVELVRRNRAVES